MSPKKPTKRVSILKKRQSSVDSPNSEQTVTAKLPRKGILFSEKKTVKEFLQCDEKTTIWGNSYEASMARSEGSGDGSQTSKKLSFDFSSSNIQMSLATTEAEKENFIISTFEDIEDVGGRQTNSLSNSTPNSSSSGIENMTVEFNAEEKRRIKKYGTDNLNITNMQFESVAVLSPRKTIFFNENANISVCVSDKVLMKPPEPRTSTVQNSSDLSVQIEPKESELFRSARKTTHKPSEMDLTLEFGPKQLPKPSIFKEPKPPKIEQIIADNSAMVMSSPPIKPPKLDDQKLAVEDFIDFMVTDTPTKNLCHNMCATKKHRITPIQNPAPKIIFSAAKSQWSNRPDLKTRLDSKDSFKDTERLVTPASQQKVKESEINFVDNFMELEFDGESRKTEHVPASLEETLVDKKKSQSNVRQTLFEKDISIDEPAARPSPRKTLFESEMEESVAQEAQLTSKESTNTLRKTIYEGDMEESIAQDRQEQQQKSFFNLSHEETRGATKSMTLVRIKDLVAHEKSSSSPNITQGSGHKSGAQSSVSCNFEDLELHKEGSVFMNFTNINDDTDISETTTELAAKAARLLKDPMATTASTSNLFSRSFHQESGTEEFLGFEGAASQSLPAVKEQRKTIYDDNMSLNTDPPSAATSLQESKSEEKIGFMSFTEIDISGIEPTVQIPNKERLTIYEDSMDVDLKSVTRATLGLKNKKSRQTILDVHMMDTTMEQTRSIKPVKSRATTYKAESIDETAMCNQMEVEAIGTFVSNRMTTFENHSIEDVMTEVQEISKGPRSRKTIYENAPINETNVHEFEFSLPRRNTQFQSFTEFEDPDKSVNLPCDATLFTSNCHQHQSILRNGSFGASNEIFSPPPEFKVPAPVGPSFEPMELTEETSSLVRHSVIVRMESSACNTETSNVDAESSIERSTHDNDEPIDLVEATFVVNRLGDESRRLMNVTDADFSLIDDESECLHESASEARRSSQASFSSNVSTYRAAVYDFLNITTQGSCLAAKQTPSTPTPHSVVRDRDFDSLVDYNGKLSALMDNLQAKEEVEQPRLAIDEFLAKLNIQPVVIPNLPQMQANYLEKSQSAIEEKMKRELADRRAKRKVQLPEIPSGSFLIKNKIECMDEEIKIERQNELLMVASIFPNARDFHFLLSNKFETDPHLSVFWELDLAFFHLNQIKLIHKKFEAFKINFTVRNPFGSMSDSTIPIYFENVLLYVNPDYRGKKSLRWKILMKELKRVIKTDNLTSMCTCSTYLFDFLESFHKEVMKTIQLVDNFYKIVCKHRAIINRHANGKIVSIETRHFANDRSDIFDIAIHVLGSLEDVSADDIVVKGTFHTLKFQPKAGITSSKGLMLIEMILYDTAKFLQDNTHRMVEEEA